MVREGMSACRAPSKSSTHMYPEHLITSVSKRIRRVYDLVPDTHGTSTHSALYSSMCLSIVMAVTARGLCPVEGALSVACFTGLSDSPEIRRRTIAFGGTLERETTAWHSRPHTGVESFGRRKL